jgi:hypothetical protein
MPLPTYREIGPARLANQQIVRPRFTTPAEVVGWMAAMQAQDYNGALWAVALRLPEAGEADIEQAIAERTIVRTWPLRGTLHFVAAADVRWMLDLLAPSIIAGSLRRRQQLALDDAELARAQTVITEALADGETRTREELMARLEAGQIATGGQRGYHILWQLALAGLICFGPRQGKQQTFVLLDEWAPNAKRMDRDEALAALAARYFGSHGPATLQDLVWWSGLKTGDARRAIEAAASQLVQAELDGTRYWMAQEIPAWDESSPHAALLPAFDEYMLGYRGRDAVLDPQHAQKIVPGSNGVFRPIFVVDGQIAGTWKSAPKKKTLTLTLSPFAPLSAAEERAVQAAAQPYGRYLGKTVEFA